MSSREGSMPNIDLAPGARNANKLFKGKQKLNLPSSPAKAFSNFIDQGNVFNIRKGKGKIERFIPESPQAGVEGAFEADKFTSSSVKSGRRIGKLFNFDF